MTSPQLVTRADLIARAPSPAFATWQAKRAEKEAAGLLPPLTIPEPFVLPRTDSDGFIRVGDLVAEPDSNHPWVVHGIVPSQGLVVVAAKPKVGKSTLTRAIALKVARGEPVLGRDTMQGPVLYLGLEDPRQAIKGHFQRMGASESDDLHVYTGRVPDQAQLWLGEQLTKRDPVLVVIDTMQFFLGVTDLNDYAQVVTALRTILGLVRGKSRAAVIVVHHAGKGERSGFDSVLGSTGITGTADTTILLKRREDNTRTVATQQRMHALGGEDMPETVLTLDDHTEPQLAGTLSDFEQAKMADRFREFFQGHPEWTERADAMAGVEGRAQDKVRALDGLYRAGEVERQGEGKRGSPYLFRCSHHTLGTEERKPETPETLGAIRVNSVPTNTGPAGGDPPARNGNGVCPKGHTIIEGICPECSPVLFLAALDAEAERLKATI